MYPEQRGKDKTRYIDGRTSLSEVENQKNRAKCKKLIRP